MRKKGRGSACVKPSLVTCPSAIASSKLDCVRGEARLISSHQHNLSKQGARTKLKALFPLIVNCAARDIAW